MSCYQSRHYAVSLIIPCRIVHNKNNKNINVALSIKSTKARDKIAMKLYHQFVETPQDKLIKSITSPGEKWASGHNLKDKIKNVCKNCPMCFVYKKAPTRTRVALALANRFKK